MVDRDRERIDIDPELAAIWKKHGQPKFFFPRADAMLESRRLHSLGSARFMNSSFVKQTLGDGYEQRCAEYDRPVVVRDGTSVTVRIYRPIVDQFDGGHPVLIFSHGGGWCMGGLDTEEFICQLLCLRLRLIIVSVAYRLAPEALFPTGIFDIYDVMKWVAVNAFSFGGNLSKGFLTGGVSGGGNFTVMATILAREDELRPELTGHLFICTGMPHQGSDRKGNSFSLFPEKLALGSWETYKDGPLVNRAMMNYYSDLAQCEATSKLSSPLLWNDYSKLGPVYYQVAGMDMWKDSALFDCDEVRKAGGAVKLDIYPGVPHVWWSVYPQLSINKQWARDLVQGTAWLLEKDDRSSRL
ncbi:hypothetical protein DV736_g6031, partial [Chaetothyriales sp. CBS 134916]